MLLLSACVLGLAAAEAEVSVLPADSPLISWGGRTVSDITGGRGRSFDWLGVQTRLAVYNASWLAISATATGSQGRGTRLRAFFKENGYDYFEGATVWVVDSNSSLNRGYSSNTSVLWQGNPWEGREYQVHTVENLVPAQYHTGVTTIHAFHSDGTFVPLNASDRLGGVANRRMEFIGDSITAATNVNRPEGARAGCGDSGFQADWSRTYSALLCHRFGAACSTIAYGGKCMMREGNCGGLQMPDYFLSELSNGCAGHPGAAPWPAKTYRFPAIEAPDALFIDLGTNDVARAMFPRAEGGDAAFELRFAQETFGFMKNATALYGKPDIQFFLNAGPMENTTMKGTLQAERAFPPISRRMPTTKAEGLGRSEGT